MKLIGVTGKSGAGKTTFSNMLAEKPNIGVIHVDDILTQIKLKYFKVIMDKNKDGEKTKVNSKLKMLLYKNKILFDLFMKFRAKLVEKPLDVEIQKLQRQGKEIVIVDDIFIKYQKIYNSLSTIFIVNRSYVDRKEAMKERDDLTLEEIVASDIAHYKGNYKDIIEGENVKKIINNGTKEDLRNIAEQVYQEQFITFKERYKQRGRANNNQRKSTMKSRTNTRRSEEEIEKS